VKIRVDEANDALYFRLDESPIVDSEEVEPDIVIDFNAEGKAVGVEIMGIKNHISVQELKRLQFEIVQ
jgi:uncharacterized protein YuzE